MEPAEADDAEADDAEADDAEEALAGVQLEDDGEALTDASVSEEAASGEPESGQAAGFGESGAEAGTAPGRPAESAGRRRRSVRAATAAANGVDSAAVRAWAAANGLSVSPRGRIRDEVLEAYRAAGN